MLNSHISELMLKNIEKEIALILQQEKYAWFYSLFEDIMDT